MRRLTADSLRGIWAALTMPWDENDKLDIKAYANNTERLCRAGVHGVYTTGSTGEFYALSFEEFRDMVDVQAEVCARNEMPLQIGCCAETAVKTLQRLEYVAQRDAVGAVQVVVPFWMELTDKEVLRFFETIYKACPEMPLVSYNIPRAKRFLLGPDYERILEVAPSLIGVKFSYAGSHFADLQYALIRTPQISYFVGENILASAMMLGARGCYSSMISTNPTYMLTMYEHARSKRWDEAIEMQMTLERFFNDAIPFIRGRDEVVIDPTFDKGAAKAAGFNEGSQRTREPHIGWSDETIAAFGDWLREHYPMFVYEGDPAQA